MLCLLALTFCTSAAHAIGVLVAAGGGAEGDIGDTSAWSYKLYRKLVLNGDRNNDGKIKVVILSTAVADSFLPNYFIWLGATEAVNVTVATKADANNPAIVDTVSTADVVFIKGGDQGVYYDEWNGTTLETNIRTVVNTNNGAIGGTSAGAMSLPQYSFSGGMDLISLDVLQDARTPFLDDASAGGSGIHTDFLSFLSNTVIDTHYTKRGRLGRTLGILGKAIQDNNNTGILAIGIEEQTGISVTSTTAEIIGVGSVDFIQQTSSTVLRRDVSRPLYYTNLRLDRLTEGWKYNLATKAPDTVNRPTGTTPVTYAGDSSANTSSLVIKGTLVSDEEEFARRVAYSPNPYSNFTGSASPYVRNSIGIIDAANSTNRGAIQESLFRALYDLPNYSGLLVTAPAQIYRNTTTPDEIRFERNSSQSANEAATIVLDGRNVTYKGLSPYFSRSDTGSQTLKAAALINLNVHVLAETAARGVRYNSRTHTVLGGP
ncbi:cyanophycinase [Anthocerotibacter panamensis]|uniref:cyanophycinase n=1 Tax=Anthocerotibacter panamensis TaxID=2857077 RepID=UPI001C404FE9|nr:cyanophycinase [Anthocerotibacter panamensis]